MLFNFKVIFFTSFIPRIHRLNHESVAPFNVHVVSTAYLPFSPLLSLATYQSKRLPNVMVLATMPPLPYQSPRSSESLLKSPTPIPPSEPPPPPPYLPSPKLEDPVSAPAARSEALEDDDPPPYSRVHSLMSRRLIKYAIILLIIVGVILFVLFITHSIGYFWAARWCEGADWWVRCFEKLGLWEGVEWCCWRYGRCSYAGFCRLSL